MTQQRKTRTTKTRSATNRDAMPSAPEGWKPPSVLDAPPPQEGMGQRWVATSILGKENTSHVMKRLREGWKPRLAETVPENFPVPTMEHGQFEGCVGVEGMVLMEMPLEMLEQRNEYYGIKNKEQNQSVQAALGKFAGSHNQDILMKDETKVEKGRGQVKVMDDL